MKGRRLTQADVLLELGRLLEVFPRPSHAPAELGKFSAPYWDVLRDACSAEQLAQAVTQIRGSKARFMPRPGELKAIAQEQPGITVLGAMDVVAEYWVWERGDGYRAPYHNDAGRMTPCPGCGRGWAWYPRLGLVHDHARHRALNLPCTGKCDQPGCAAPPVAGEREPVRESEGTIWQPPPPAVPEPGAAA